MQIKGVSLAQFTDVVNVVSDFYYGGNVIVHADAHEITSSAKKHAFSPGAALQPGAASQAEDHPEALPFSGSLTARLACAASRGLGARRAASGRRGPWACWHAYRDVLKMLFWCYPEASVRTAMATYKGVGGFTEAYPATATINVGSLIEPVYMPDLCDCAMVTALDWDRIIDQIGNWRAAA